MISIKIIFTLNSVILLLSVSVKSATFSNPILEIKSPDPAILRHGDYYYISISTENDSSITILRSRVLTDFRDAVNRVVFRLRPGWFGLWAPEIHFVDGQLYIYFCMDNGVEANKRSYVIQADDPNDPLGSWSQNPISLLGDVKDFDIDGTIMNHGNGNKYFVWAGIKNGTSLFIAPLINATTVGHPKMKLRRPTFTWENIGTPTVEAPYFFYNNSWSFMTFSAGSTWLSTYQMGVMGIHADMEPLNPDEWWYGPSDPIFWSNDEEKVYTTGHASFTLSPDGTETWMAYHGTDVTEDVIYKRIARLERIDWSASGFPVFPRPHGRNSLLPVPSGQGKGSDSGR